jgi:hypothetical protein
MAAPSFPISLFSFFSFVPCKPVQQACAKIIALLSQFVIARRSRQQAPHIALQSWIFPAKALTQT